MLVSFAGGAALHGFSGKMTQHVNLFILAFDFQVTGDPVDDCVVCAINNQNLFSLPLKFAPDAKTVSTDMMNISQFAGQEVEIMFGMTGGTAVDAELFVDGLRIISVPQNPLRCPETRPNLDRFFPSTRRSPPLLCG